MKYLLLLSISIYSFCTTAAENFWVQVDVSLFNLPFKSGKALLVNNEGELIVDRFLVNEALTLDNYQLTAKLSDGRTYQKFKIGECRNDEKFPVCRLRIQTKDKFEQFMHIEKFNYTSLIKNLFGHHKQISGLSFNQSDLAYKNKSWYGHKAFKTRFQNFMRGQSHSLSRKYIAPANKLLREKIQNDQFDLDQLNSLNFMTVSFNGYQGSYDFKLFTGLFGIEKCVTISSNEKKKSFKCELKDLPGGYIVSFDKNLEKKQVLSKKKLVDTYYPTKFLEPYTKAQKWKSFGVTSKQYQQLHTFQNKPYDCRVQGNMSRCVISLNNFPQLDQVGLQYTIQYKANSEVVTLVGYSNNSYFSQAIFEATEIAMKTIKRRPITKIDRLPASK